MIQKYLKKKFEKKNDTEQEISQKEIIELRKKLDLCFSRFQSIQMLNSNGNYKDAHLLQTYLFVDIMNFMLSYENRNQMAYDISLEILRFSYSDLENEKLRAMISFSFFARIFELNEISEKQILAFEKEIKRILKELENFLQKLEESSNHRLTIISVSVLLLASLCGFLFYRFNPPALVPDSLQLFYKESRISEYTEKKSFKKPIQLTRKWHTYSFSFPEETELASIRFYPIKQRNIRFQIKNIRIISGDNKILKNIDFRIEKFTNPYSFSIFSAGNGLKLLPKKEGYVELITLNYKPFFEIDSKLIFVKKILFIARFSEINTPFEGK